MAARGAANPYLNLEAAVEGVKKMRHDLGTGEHDSLSIAKLFGHESLSGPAKRRVASLVYYGLTEKTGNGYRLTELSTRLTHPHSDSEYQDALKSAFLEVGLYTDVYEKYMPDRKLPRELANILVRDFGILDKSKDRVAKILKTSGQYAGLLNEAGEYLGDTPRADENIDENIGNQTLSNNDHPAPPQAKPEGLAALPMPASASSNQSQEMRIALTEGKFAFLQIPAEINEKDISIVKKWIELLELQVESTG